MAKITQKKIIKNSKGKNIRFASDVHKLISKFCDERGYKLGSFSEKAAIEKMEKESSASN